jgi:hypothetical protein
MEPRYITRKIPPTEIGGRRNGVKTSSSLVNGWKIRDQFEDVFLPGAFSEQSDAENECHRLNNSSSRLVLKSWNRSLEALKGSLSTDARGREVLLGLSREESERYIELMTGDVTDEFIDLERKHRTARTGIAYEQP